MKYIIKKLWLLILLLIFSIVILIIGHQNILYDFSVAYISFGLFVLAVGILCGIIGALLPRNFDPEKGIFKCREWEDSGKFYDRVFSIRKWKDEMFDISKVINGIEKKSFQDGMDPREKTRRLVQETCVAELTHWGLIILSPLMFLLCRNAWMWILWPLYIISNLLDIMIQRFNRPRLLKIFTRKA